VEPAPHPVLSGQAALRRQLPHWQRPYSEEPRAEQAGKPKGGVGSRREGTRSYSQETSHQPAIPTCG
jgi:hypothetical protein